MKDKTLVILAAGMGSRYGGLKQIDQFGLSGEAIIEFSIYDAIEAGFNKVVLIIRKEHEALFEENLGAKIRPFVELDYAYQALTDLPDGYSVPEGREKPWGTTHALLAAKKHVTSPFAIINADDFYGKESYQVMADFLDHEVSDEKAAMIGFILDNTLTDHGTVTRGVCVNDKGYLSDIVETEGIRRDNGKIIQKDASVIPDNTSVSMNFWGFTPAIFALMRKQFISFLNEQVEANPLKAEALLPNDVGALIKKHELQVAILTTPEKWIGVTYQEDKPIVKERLAGLQTSGKYPEKLWLSR